MFTLEIVRQSKPAATLKAAILDFDGTLSLIREGWQQVMIPFFIEVLSETPHHESPENIERCVRDFVDLLTGKQTIYQCIQLADEVTKRGKTPLEPIEYKNEYHRRLNLRIKSRLEELKNGGEPAKHTVPGSYALLNMLREHGIVVYLASGTDEVFVKEEADLLRVTELCNGGVYGAQDDYKTFSKAMVIQRIIKEHHLQGTELIGFGDGYVEIENVHDIGGFAVGVATNESERQGVDAWKRGRLIEAGADWIIPDYSDINKIEKQLF
jgi:phosphoglycolate phosphatase-like HAD superfamily hydrolase